MNQTAQVIIESGMEISGILWLCWCVWVTPEIGRVLVLGQEPSM